MGPRLPMLTMDHVRCPGLYHAPTCPSEPMRPQVALDAAFSCVATLGIESANAIWHVCIFRVMSSNVLAALLPDYLRQAPANSIGHRVHGIGIVRVSFGCLRWYAVPSALSRACHRSPSALRASALTADSGFEALILLATLLHIQRNAWLLTHASSWQSALNPAWEPFSHPAHTHGDSRC